MMTNKEKALLCIDALKKCYPDASCSLIYSNPLQLLIAARLAAQCTDARVNIVTPSLFKKFPDVHAFASANIDELEEYICSCGLYKTKARDIIAMCRMLIEKYYSEVPDSIEELILLPGVGRKTANLIVGDIFGKPSVVVDTHCIRITGRLGFHNVKDPIKIENILRECLDPKESTDFCHRLVIHGRAVCSSGKPSCEICCLKNFCDYNIRLSGKENIL